MDYKKEVGRRIREARLKKGLTLAGLSRKTDDVLDLRRIGAYENGVRMLGQQEAVILGRALGLRPAYIMALEDSDTRPSALEEQMLKNWRSLTERDRMDFFRKIEAQALMSRDPAADVRVERFAEKGRRIKAK